MYQPRRTLRTRDGTARAGIVGPTNSTPIATDVRVTLLRRAHELFFRLLPQLTKFGVVGLLGFVVDVGGFNLLRFAGGEGPLYAYPLTAKLVSGALATVVSWLGNRYWTFRHARRSAAHHEFAIFVVMCSIGTGIALGFLWVSHYVLGLTSPLADNVSANGLGLVCATVFRFWAYHTHVFIEPTDVAEPAPELTAAV